MTETELDTLLPDVAFLARRVIDSRWPVDARDIADAWYLAAFLEPSPEQPAVAPVVTPPAQPEIADTEESPHSADEPAKAESQPEPAPDTPRLDSPDSEQPPAPGGESPKPPPARAPEPPAPTEDGRLYLPANTETPAHAVTASAFDSPDTRAVPNLRLLARALRFLPRTVEDTTRPIVDEEATVELWAEKIALSADVPLMPVLRPQPVRWAELALVVDRSPTMYIWREVVEEITEMLRWQGAFRDVRLWEMETAAAPAASSTEAPLPLPTLYSVASPLRGGDVPGEPRSYRELLSARQDRLVVVVTDALAPAWRDGRVFRLLHTLGRQAGVALWQVLPESLWDRTALGVPRWLARSLRPAPLNNQLLVAPRPGAASGLQTQRRPIPGAVPLPIIGLSESSLRTWARLQAGLGRASVPSLLLRPDLTTPETAQSLNAAAQEEGQRSVDERIARFRERASEPAQDLARYLTVVPLALPVLRLVQHALLPDSTQGHLAEFLMSGLIEPDPTIPTADGPRFRWVSEAVRDRIAARLSGGAAERVLREVGISLGVPPETVRNFAALLAQGEPLGVNLTPLQHAYALLSIETLTRFGFLGNRPPAPSPPVPIPPQPELEPFTMPPHPQEAFIKFT